MLRDMIEREAAAANLATASLRDDLVAETLRRASALVRERRRATLEANAAKIAGRSRGLEAVHWDRLVVY